MYDVTHCTTRIMYSTYTIVSYTIVFITAVNLIKINIHKKERSINAVKSLYFIKNKIKIASIA